MRIKKVLLNKKVIGFYCPKCNQKVYISKPFSFCVLCGLAYTNKFIKEVLKCD